MKNRTYTSKCKNWKPSDEDPAFCSACGFPASHHRVPTPGATRSFRYPPEPAKTKRKRAK